MAETNDEKMVITPEEAESLLIDDTPYVHNFADAGMCLLGVDYDREDAIAAFHKATSIEIGGPGCKGMKHPIVVHEPDGRYTFFEADMEKVEAFEAARAEETP